MSGVPPPPTHLSHWDPRVGSSHVEQSVTPQRKVFVCVSKEYPPHHLTYNHDRDASYCVASSVQSTPVVAKSMYRDESVQVGGSFDPTPPSNPEVDEVDVSSVVSSQRGSSTTTSPPRPPSPPAWDADRELGSIRRLRVQEDEYNKYVLASLAQSSPQVLATYNPRKGSKSSQSISKKPVVLKEVLPDSTASEVPHVSVGQRLFEQANERSKKLQRLRDAASERDRAALSTGFKPHISSFAKSHLTTSGGSVFQRLADEDVSSRREHLTEAAAKEEAKAAQAAHTPVLTKYPVRDRGDVVAEQMQWDEDRRRRIDELRSQAESAHRFTPMLNPTSNKLADAMRAERGSGPIHDRLIQEGDERRRQREELSNPKTSSAPKRHQPQGAAAYLNQVKNLCGQATTATHDRLYYEAAERERGLEELRREQELTELAKCTSSHTPFTPRINSHSVQICAGSRSVSGDHHDHHANRHDGCVSQYQLEADTKVIVEEVGATMCAPHLSTYSEALAQGRYAREGVSHLPVHERLAHHPTSSSRSATPPHPSRMHPTPNLYSFSPSLNRHSRQLDQRVVREDHRGSATNRVNHLFEKQLERDRKVEALRREQDAYERNLSSHVSSIVRGRVAPASDSGREVLGSTISERTAMWHQKREAKLNFQREVHARESIADCTFTPVLTGGRSSSSRR